MSDLGHKHLDAEILELLGLSWLAEKGRQFGGGDPPDGAGGRTGLLHTHHSLASLTTCNKKETN